MRSGLLVLFLSSFAGAGFADGSPPAPLTTVERAIAAIGPPEKIATIRSVSFAASGYEYREAERQGRSPETTLRARLDEGIAADLEHGRVAFESRTGDPTVGRRWRRTVCDRASVITLNLVSRTAERRTASDGELVSYERRIPLALLLELRANPEKLSGSESELLYRPTVGAPLRLQFRPEDGALASVESRVDFPGEGEIAVSFEYFGRTVAGPGLALPAGHRKRVGERLMEEVEYSRFAVNEPSPFFEIPEDLRAEADPPGTVRRVAPGVFVVENLSSYNLLFVEFRDFVVALEAPAPYPGLQAIPARIGSGSREICEEYLKRIRATVPGKPLRYFAVTHHHSDHAGGATVFFEAGATLLTTPGNRTYFESIARGRPIETISARRTLADESQELRLVNVGRNPHTDEMLVAYLPKARIVYQSDLFFPDDRIVDPTRHYPPVMHFFAEWLKRERIGPARIFGFHTAGFQSIDDVNDVLSSREQKGPR